MNKKENTALISELFNYKKSLNMEQDNVERIVSKHLDMFNCDEFGNSVSQKYIAESLKANLKAFEYDKTVVSVLERVSAIMEEDELYYELEDLYRVLERNNQGQVYRHVMNIVNDILVTENTHDRDIKIHTELKIHDWIPYVKNFIFKYTTDPNERLNITSEGGKVDNVYSFVEKVELNEEQGFLTYIADSWFFIGESKIEKCVPSDVISDQEKLYSVNQLKKAIEISEIRENKILFVIDEGLELGINISSGDLYLNEEKIQSESNLDSIFGSSLIPFMRKNMYPIIKEAVNSLDKLTELDFIKKVSNITKPHLESFAMNYGSKMYVYNVNRTAANSFYEYDSATILVNETNNTFGIDITEFFKNKFKGEEAIRTELKLKEKTVAASLAEVNENIEKIEATGLLERSEELRKALELLKENKESLEKEIEAIKGAVVENKIKK